MSRSETQICFYENEGAYVGRVQKDEEGMRTVETIEIDEFTYFDLVTQTAPFIDLYQEAEAETIGTCRSFESLLLNPGEGFDRLVYARAKECGADVWTPTEGEEEFTSIRDQFLELIN